MKKKNFMMLFYLFLIWMSYYVILVWLWMTFNRKIITSIFSDISFQKYAQPSVITPKEVPD